MSAEEHGGILAYLVFITGTSSPYEDHDSSQNAVLSHKPPFAEPQFRLASRTSGETSAAPESEQLTMPVLQSFRVRLRRFFVREDAAYDHYSSTYQAKTPGAKLIYLFLYFLPGIIVFLAVNIEPLFRAEMAMTGLSARWVQYVWVLVITFGWHMFLPFLVLRCVDRLSLRESFAFLGLNRVDGRGLLFVLPLFMALFALISLPYLKYVAPVIESWTQAIPLFRIPTYSIFQDTPENIYSFPPLALLFLGIGNFLGEELYFRGYLLKKTAFLGEANWTVNSVLFALYHVWQVQQTWPMIGLILMFGILMKLRKDLWVMVGFHFFVNMWMAYGT